jgi:hypothetical protein
MTTPTLFDAEQPVQLEHVSGQIAQMILGFVRARYRTGQVEFHADELREHIARHTDGHTAPASADRILRALRKAGRVQYVVVSRRHSLYRLL